MMDLHEIPIITDKYMPRNTLIIMGRVGFANGDTIYRIEHIIKWLNTIHIPFCFKAQ